MLRSSSGSGSVKMQPIATAVAVEVEEAVAVAVEVEEAVAVVNRNIYMLSRRNTHSHSRCLHTWHLGPATHQQVAMAMASNTMEEAEQ
jgi:hypothetical protein